MNFPARAAVEELRDGARTVRNYALAALCSDALAGDAAAWQRVAAILAGDGDPGTVIPPEIAAALAEHDRAVAELDRALAARAVAEAEADADVARARAAYEAAYAGWRAATGQEPPR